jgi:hypothetical protein
MMLRHMMLRHMMLRHMMLHLIAAFATAAPHAVPLFGKPVEETGQLILLKSGLDVLRAQQGPFAIVSAVGPTRTGKSSLLGRAFLRGAQENVFEIGGGVTSFTTGVHILSEPIVLETPRGPLKVLLVDTEGFHGIGGRTSRTYEANLFGLVWLMSSVLIFNSMFPVDASTVKSLNLFGKEAVGVLKELSMHHTAVSRRPAHLLWVVQNFNFYNLQNSHMTVEQLHSTLSNGTGVSADSMAATRLLGSSTKIKRGLLDALFASSRMLPVRVPVRAPAARAPSPAALTPTLVGFAHPHRWSGRTLTTRFLQTWHRCPARRCAQSTSRARPGCGKQPPGSRHPCTSVRRAVGAAAGGKARAATTSV